MTEKKGFLRRVFSFGQQDETPVARPEEPVVTAPVGERAGSFAGGEDRAGELPAEGSIETPAPFLIDEDERALSGERLDPRDDGAPGSQGYSSTDRAEPAADDAIGTPVAADEPAWLAPDAPEPVADFSWLDAEGADDVPPTRRDEDELQAMPAETPDGRGSTVAVSPYGFPVAPEPSNIDESRIADVSPAPEPSDVAASTEPDFSFLDPDAPLPEDEEDDFSWLEPEASLQGDDERPSSDTPTPGAVDTASLATTAAAGIAAAAVSASPTAASTGEAGWRLREASAPAPAAPAPRTTFIDRLREGLSRSSNQLSGSITSLFTKRRLDEETLQDFEDVLLQADLGVETSLRITERLSEGRFGKEITGDQVRTILADEVEATLRPVALPLELDLEKKPHVILVVGVNGTGKTTTIGKLAAKLTRANLKVTLCAGDTFRAAAVEQLKIWGERTGSEVIAKAIGADAAGLAFEAYDAAVENGSDVLIIDTAGRLQNKAELMAELEKIVRVLQKREPDAPHTVLQTLDATTGQNALSQVEIFRNVAGVNGLVMTKLDGTARGGILVAIAAKYRLPVYFVGVGEGIDDLEPFKARDFALAIAGKT